MRAFRAAALAVAISTAACRIERTPSEYIDREDPLAEQRQAAVDELQARLLALGQAFSRGTVTEAMIALAPARGARVVVPESDVSLEGPDEIAPALGRWLSEAPRLRVDRIQVWVGPEANLGWFEVQVELLDMEDGDRGVAVTGLYLLRESAWELVQAHLSTSAPPSPEASADEAPAAGE